MSSFNRQKALLSGCKYERVRKAVWPVLNAAGLTWGTVIARDRRPHVVRIRWRVFHALRETGMSLPQIGRIVQRDHTTVLHGIRRLSNDV